MARSESSFNNRDTNITYPEVLNVSRTAGFTVTFKNNPLTSYATTDFYFDLPSIVHLSGTAGASSLVAYTNLVNTLNTYKTSNPNLDIKILSTKVVQYGATSFQYIMTFSVFRL